MNANTEISELRGFKKGYGFSFNQQNTFNNGMTLFFLNDKGGYYKR